MKLNQSLNLVIPIEQDGGTIYVHATPPSAEVFDRYFLPISKTFAEIYNSGLGITAGPRVAAKYLRKISMEMGVWEGTNGVEAGLVNEIRRLANVIGIDGQIIPLQDIINKKELDKDNLDEVENALSFFSVASVMHLKKERGPVLNGAAALWGAQITSLDCTAFRDSLRTLTGAENTGGTPTAEPVQAVGLPIPS